MTSREPDPLPLAASGTRPVGAVGTLGAIVFALVVWRVAHRSTETVSHSDAVSLVNEQHGDRIEIRSISSRTGTNLVDYTFLVPSAAFVSR